MLTAGCVHGVENRVMKSEPHLYLSAVNLAHVIRRGSLTFRAMDYNVLFDLHKLEAKFRFVLDHRSGVALLPQMIEV